MRRLFGLPAALALAALVAAAFMEAEGRWFLLTGLTDPVQGLDHFMVLLAVGAWAGRLGNGARWQLPLTFLGGLTFGFLLGNGPPLTVDLVYLIHILAVAPVFLLLFGIVTVARLPPLEMVSTIALLGGCHGLLHSLHGQTFGIAPVSLQGLWFGLGVLISAAGLLIVGILVGLRISRAE